MNDETELHLGTIRGYRWWTLTPPLLDEWPVPAVADAWTPGWLRATNGTEWLPGVNASRCVNGVARHPDSNIPANECGCGFWAYWKPQHHDALPPGLPVFGAIDATGDVIVGENMLRAAEAEIVALHLPLTIGPKRAQPARGSGSLDLGQALARNRGFTGRLVNIPGRDPDDWLAPPSREPEPTPEEIAEAEMRGEAWVAVIGDRLRQMYPGAEICETRDLLLANYPPDPEYSTLVPCQWCREPRASYAHEFACPQNPFRTAGV